jgi:hypothetical protein
MAIPLASLSVGYTPEQLWRVLATPEVIYIVLRSRNG